MSNFNVNINVEDVLSQRERETTKKAQNTFSIKNYLQARLADNEDSKEITIRLLPFTPDGGSPFHKIFTHQVKVNKEVSPSGWKRFPCPVHNHMGDACPFCETAAQAKVFKKNATTESEKKKFEEVEFANYAKAAWLVRCIERGHEEDGVKYWLFSDSKQKDGIYDKIYAIFKKRLEKGKNIFDVNEGKDLCLTLNKDSMGKTRITVTDDDEWTPITTDFELGSSWINDTKTWTDVYTFKPYDYMSIIVQGGVPVYSKEEQKYVDKKEYEAKEKADIDANLSRATVDLSQPVTVTGAVIENMTVTKQEQPIVTDDDDDLPF